MLASLTTFLFCLIAAASLFQPSLRQCMAAFVFIGITLCHELFLSEQTGFTYYGSAAFFDFMIILILSRITPVQNLALSLQKICIVSMGLNLMGWLLWVSYNPPLLYNLAFVALYAWSAFTLIKRTGGDVGSHTVDRWGAGVRPFNIARRNYLFKDEG